MTVAVLIGVQALWALWAFRSANASDLKQGWMGCLYQFPMLNAVMMPVLAAVTASRLCDTEHKGHMLKLLETVMPAGRLFDAKLLCGAVYMLTAPVLQLLLILVIGQVKGFEGEVPVEMMGYYLLFTAAVNLTIFLFQQVLSLLFVNQMVPLSIGLTGGLFGLFILFFPLWLEKLLPWGYYGAMAVVGMDWNRTTRVTKYYWTSADWGGFAALAAMFCVIYLIGRLLFIRKEN